ncbi:MAG: HAD-IA family hydrolase [Ruminococcus sp.]|nr:HAD-IA family hydrolase [Ruminococcus sp.]
MTLEKIKTGDERTETIKRIYTDSFPENERFGLDNILRLADEGALEVFAIMEKAVTAGMAVCCIHGSTAYICYIAIDKDMRGCGLGSRAVSGICNLYKGKQVVLEIETLDPCAENYPQRKQREGFYLRLGFAHTNKYIRYCGVTYELLFTGTDKFDSGDFDEFMQSRKEGSFQPVRFDARSYTTCIFDLDGTLLDTLDDLTASTNYAMRSVGCKEHTKEAVCSFVGNGIKKLIQRALPPDVPQSTFDKAFEVFKAHYGEHCFDSTKPYPGILSMMKELIKQGKKIAVVSNKADFAVKKLCRDYFGDLVHITIGEKEGVRKKPAPDTVIAALAQLGSTPEESVYIGDSDVDIQTALNSGMDCISVLWGFRSEEFLTRHGAKVFAQTPGEICLLTLAGLH